MLGEVRNEQGPQKQKELWEPHSALGSERPGQQLSGNGEMCVRACVCACVCMCVGVYDIIFKNIYIFGLCPIPGRKPLKSLEFPQ